MKNIELDTKGITPEQHAELAAEGVTLPDFSLQFTRKGDVVLLVLNHKESTMSELNFPNISLPSGLSEMEILRTVCKRIIQTLGITRDEEKEGLLKRKKETIKSHEYYPPTGFFNYPTLLDLLGVMYACELEMQHAHAEGDDAESKLWEARFQRLDAVYEEINEACFTNYEPESGFDRVLLQQCEDRE